MRRALRRHHYKRLFKSRKNKLWWWFDEPYLNSDKFRHIITTPTPCSCSMCGNPRKYFGKIKKQEYLSLINMKEQCEEYGIYTTLRINNIPYIE